jgi:heme ABC exporter ATP-binding subunit CcmA
VSPVIDVESAVVLVDGFPLLAGATLCVAEPSVTVLVGPNGAGKTSLLRLVAGLVPLASGRGVVLDVDLAHGDRRLLRRRVGWLGHQGAFYDDLTVRDNLVFAARALDRPVELVDGALTRVGLNARDRTLTRRLSAGQRRRLGLAWLLVRRPSLWLLDEPYASLDDATRDLLDGLIRDAVDGGVAVVVTSHDPLRDPRLHVRTLAMAGGRVVAGDR